MAIHLFYTSAYCAEAHGSQCSLGTEEKKSHWCFEQEPHRRKLWVFSCPWSRKGLSFMIQLSKSEILVIYFRGGVKPRSTLHTQLCGILLNSINPEEKKKSPKC